MTTDPYALPEDVDCVLAGECDVIKRLEQAESKLALDAEAHKQTIEYYKGQVEGAHKRLAAMEGERDAANEGIEQQDGAIEELVELLEYATFDEAGMDTQFQDARARYRAQEDYEERET